MHDNSAAPASPGRRLASWLRRQGRPGSSSPIPPDQPAAETPPPPRLRPQPEDDASVYPLF